MRSTLYRLLAVIMIIYGAGVAARPYSLDDLLRHEDIGRISVDPKGRWLAYEKYEAHLTMQRQDRLSLGQILRARPFIVDLHGQGAARPLLDSEAAGTILLGFSPSGVRIAVARLRGSSFQFGIVTLATGAVHWWPYAPAYDGFRPFHDWLDDDRMLVLAQKDDKPAARLGLDWPSDHLMRKRWDDAAAGNLAVSTSGSGRYLQSYGGGDQQLLMVDANNGGARTLNSGPIEQMILSPNGKYVALIKAGRARQPTGAVSVQENDSYFARTLHVLDLASARQWEPCEQCELPGDPRWSDDGMKIGFVTDRAGRLEALMADMKRHLWAGVVADGRRRKPSVGCMLSSHQNVPAGARSSVQTSDGPTKWVVPMACRRTLPPLAAAWEPVKWRDSEHGPLVQNGLKVIRLPIAGDGTISSIKALQLTRANTTLFRIAAKSGQISLLLAGSRPARLVMDLNKAMAGIEPARMRPLSHRSIDGSTVTSWLFLPPGTAEGEKWPLVVIPYPGQVYGDAAPADQQVGAERFHTNAQLLAASGFAVLLPSVPMPAVLPDTGFDFAAALAPAIDAAVSTGPCDPERVALWGHSYGGYAVAMAAAQSERFRGVVASAGLYDLAATIGTFARQGRLSPEAGLAIAASYGWAEAGQGRMGLAPWLAPARYIANSPVYQAGRVKTPMLIVGADRDFSPIEQGEQLFSALFRQGKDAQLVTYWGERHVIGSPANLRDFYARVIGFLQENLVDRAPPGQPTAGAVRSSHASSARR